MPTITFSLKDIQKLVGKNLTIEELSALLEFGKCELEDYQKDEDEVTVSLGDTNLPYLWSVEGIARMIKGILGKEKGCPKLKTAKGPYKILVDPSVAKVRPYIAAFVAKGCKVDDYLIKQIVQLQEKLCESYGRRRDKLALGVYKYDKIKFPIHYKATHPTSTSFIPLDFKKEMTQQEILEDHPKGREYAWILKDQKKLPLLVDDSKEVLSFPPIINSALTGKIEPGDENIFVEATGTDMDSVLLAINIFAYALSDRGFEINSVEVKYQKKKVVTPASFDDSIKINFANVRKMLGVDINDAEIRKSLEKARYDTAKDSVLIPDYRRDILHEVDVVEDIAIFFGYDRIKESRLSSYSLGETYPLVHFIDKVRELLIGLSVHEIISPILSNKEILYNKMNLKDFGTVEIENMMSETYSVLRSWLIPLLLDFLSKNKHVEYPQNIFEQGLVSVRDVDEVYDYERVAVVLCSEKSDFTKIKKVLNALFLALGLEYKIEEAAHGSFIEGRVGRVSVAGKKVAYIGEMHPSVLQNFGIEAPVAALEINLTELFSLVGKK